MLHVHIGRKSASHVMGWHPTRADVDPPILLCIYFFVALELVSPVFHSLRDVVIIFQVLVEGRKGGVRVCVLVVLAWFHSKKHSPRATKMEGVSCVGYRKKKKKNSFFNRKQLTPSVLFDKGVVVVVVYLVWFFLPPIKKHTTSIFCREYHTRIKKWKRRSVCIWGTDR